MFEVDKYIYRSMVFTLELCAIIGVIAGCAIALKQGDIPVQLAALIIAIFAELATLVVKSK